MLRVHCMQLFYNLSDPAMEDALYEIESMRHFAGLQLDRLPDETTILKFRHFLERHGLGKVLFQEVNKYLAKNGLMLREGSIVDATIISAPSSTKNSKDKLGLIHSIETTAANVHDIVPADKLLHGEEQRVFGDAGYLGIQKTRRAQAPQRCLLVYCQTAWHPPEARCQATESRKNQSQYPCQGGAPLSVHQTRFWLWQGSLSWTGQKHSAPALTGGVQQPADQ